MLQPNLFWYHLNGLGTQKEWAFKTFFRLFFPGYFLWKLKCQRIPQKQKSFQKTQICFLRGIEYGMPKNIWMWRRCFYKSFNIHLSSQFCKFLQVDLPTSKFFHLLHYWCNGWKWKKIFFVVQFLKGSPDNLFRNTGQSNFVV